MHMYISDCSCMHMYVHVCMYMYAQYILLYIRIYIHCMYMYMYADYIHVRIYIHVLAVASITSEDYTSKVFIV